MLATRLASSVTGIRRPVAVVAAVQPARRTVHRELDAGDAARAEHDLLPSRLVHRPVAEEPRVGAQQRRVLLEQLAQMSRAGLLLALEEELEVHRRRTRRRARSASSAASIATIGALSSLAERA